MQEKGLLKHWILPELGLNKKTIYAERPPGNSPEMMPWDCSLNNDLVEAVMRHVSVCSFASRDEVQKFKLTSPKDVTEAYQKLMAWGGEEDGMRRGLYVPGPERIKGDITKVFSSMHEIVIAGGSLVEKLGNQFRNGRRPKKIGANWGGKRVKGSGLKKFSESKPLHPDASSIWKKAIVKYEFAKPMKSPKVDCSVKSQSDDGCDDENKSEEHCDPQRSEAVSLEEVGESFLVSSNIEEDE
jgi:hypothetical protein